MKLNAVANAVRTAVGAAKESKEDSKSSAKPAASGTSTAQAERGASTPRRASSRPTAGPGDAKEGQATSGKAKVKMPGITAGTAGAVTGGGAGGTGAPTPKAGIKVAGEKTGAGARGGTKDSKDGSDKLPAKEPAPKPPVAGGDRNARTNTTPAGTSAAELDAKLPASERDAAVASQNEATERARQARQDARQFGEDPVAVERSVLASHYKDNPTYVDPESGRVYDASYDEATGNLTLTRNDDEVVSPKLPELPTSPYAPTSTRDDDYVEDPKPKQPGTTSKSREGASGAEERRGASATTPTPAPSDSATHDHEAEGIAHSHGDDPVNGVDDGVIGGGPGSDGMGGRENVTYVVDEVIVIAPDGSRTTTTSYAPKDPPAGGSDESIVIEESTDRRGRVTSNTTTQELTRHEDGGVVTDRTRIATEGDQTVQEFRNERTDTNGDTTTRSAKIELERGEVQSDHRIDRATANGVTISDSQYTRYENGTPENTRIVRHATVGDSTRAEYYDVAYDDDGYSVEITPAPSTDRDPLDEWIETQAGPLQPGEQRPAFGVMRQGSDYEFEGRTTRNPIYLSSIGVQTNVDGVKVFVEGDSIAASDSLEHSIQRLRDSWAGMPEDMRGAAETIDLLQGRSNGDRGNSTKFESEFHAGASAGGTHMTYWLDNDPNANTTRHEYGHLTGDRGGAPDEDAWDAAMEADQELGLREQLGELDESELRFINGMDPLLTDALGATSYADKHLTTNGNENDDWAESIMMYLSSRENGGLVQQRMEDGTVRTYTFEELFPERARILEGYYNLGPAPDVAPPEWREASGAGFGSLGDLAGALTGAARAAAGAEAGG